MALNVGAFVLKKLLNRELFVIYQDINVTSNTGETTSSCRANGLLISSQIASILSVTASFVGTCSRLCVRLR